MVCGVDGMKLRIEDNQAEDKRDNNRDGKARLKRLSARPCS